MTKTVSATLYPPQLAAIDEIKLNTGLKYDSQAIRHALDLARRYENGIVRCYSCGDQVFITDKIVEEFNRDELIHMIHEQASVTVDSLEVILKNADQNTLRGVFDALQREKVTVR